MASPAARGLFQKAIGESGAAFGDTLPTDTLEAREKTRWRLGCLAGRQVTGGTARAADGQDSGCGEKQERRLSPVVDGKLLTEPVPDTYAAGKQAHVPLLAGWNRDEGSFLAMRA